ncbi:hypothetical protein D9M72_408560 [compost metagenome]
MADDVVVGQYPCAWRADGVQRHQGVSDDTAQAVDVQARMEIREIERLVHFVRADPVGQTGQRVHIGFGTQDAVRTVLGQDTAPGPVDVMQGRLAEHGCVMAGVAVAAVAVGPAAPLRQAGSLHQCVGHIHAESGHAPAQPETQHPLELIVDCLVVPVEVGLGGVEEVEVPLPGPAVRLRDSCPGGSAKVRLPVVGRLFTIGSQAVPEDKHVTFRTASGGGEGSLESGVLVRAVIGNEVHDHPQLQAGCLHHHGVEVGQGAEQRIDVAVVADVVAGVLLR